MQVMGDDEIAPRVLWSVWGTLFLRVTLQIKSHLKKSTRFWGVMKMEYMAEKIDNNLYSDNNL